MQELEEQLAEVQTELHASAATHEGKTAEQVYAERLEQLQLQDGAVQDGEKVVLGLLARCQLWLEIVQEKCDTQNVCLETS